jgi:hypothetical protein
VNIATRLLPRVAPEVEWHFLMHDMFVGERCGARLLERMSCAASEQRALARMLARQANDERRHVTLYGALLGQRVDGAPPRYECDLERLVDGLPCLTLQIFALQALVEGISLGALEYRKRVLDDAPSQAADAEVWADELRHVRFAYGFMRELIARDGVVPRTDFEAVTASLFTLFEGSFAAERIGAFVRDAYGIADAGIDARPSPGKRMLWSATLRTVLKNRTSFLEHYDRSATDCLGERS